MANLTFYQAERLAGLFAQALSAGQWELAAGLFTPDAVLELPDRGEALTGREAIRARLQAETAGWTIRCLNSPALGDNGESGSYFLNSFARAPGQPGHVVYFGERLDLRFRDGAISHMRWREMLSFLPCECVWHPENCTRPLTLGEPLSDANAAALEQCAGRWCHAAALGDPVRLSMLCAPVLSVGIVPEQAQAIYLAMVYDSCPGEERLRFHVDRLHFVFQRQGESWQIKDVRTETLLELPPLPPSPGTPPQAAEMLRLNRAIPLPPEGPVPAPEDCAAIQTAAAHWTAAIRSCDPSYFFTHCLARDHPQLCFHVIAPKDGLAGFWEQADLMRQMDLRQPKKQGSHCLCSPWLVQMDACHAFGWWFDSGWTLLAEAFGVDRPPYPALPAIGRYMLSLEKRNGRWQVFHFHWGPLYQHGSFLFDPARSRGWAGSPEQKRWPLLFAPDSLDGTDAFAADPMAPWRK